MKYLIFTPTRTLAEYVRFFWTLEGDQSYEHRSVADGGVEMIFHYHGAFDETTPRGKRRTALSAIQGTSSGYRVYTCPSAFGIFGVYFYPFAVPALFDIPADELSDRMPDIETLLGAEGRHLEDLMMTSRSNAERMSFVSTFLEGRVKKIEKRKIAIHRVIHSLIHLGGKIAIDQTANACCLSRRQFERAFKGLSGFSPKMYERIIRFQNAADEYRNQDKSLTQIALQHGYYDHAHFTNDFKKFSGYRPKDYFSGREIGYEWREADTSMSGFSKN